jgi:hypothetical protein
MVLFSGSRANTAMQRINGRLILNTMIPTEQQAVLRNVGSFLFKAGDSIYNTRGGPWQPDDTVIGITLSTTLDTSNHNIEF